MRFDDRLSTVLGTSAEGPHERAVQWRQLVELVARGAGRSRPDLRDQALRRIASLMLEVPESVRAAAARAIAGPDVPAELVALFAANGLEASAPLVTSAELDEAGWAAVSAVASPSVSAMLAALRPSSATIFPKAPAAAVTEPAPLEPSTPAPAAPRPIELQREVLAPGMFRWECGPDGQIDWVEGAPRAALIGRSLADDLDKRFAARLPFEDETIVLVGEGSLSGEWRWTGTPAFLPQTGRFAGYRGTARREGPVHQPAAESSVPLDSDSLRELVHELRTPLNAIIGFGDIIGGQYFGPAHRGYRERAEEIVHQARRLLEAVEDLDLAARLRSVQTAAGDGGSLTSFFPALRLALLEEAAMQDVSLTISMRGPSDRSAIPSELAERLLRRFLFAVLAAAKPGERLELVVDRIGNQLAVAVDRPQAVRGLSEDEILDPGLSASGSSMGLGFTLRLVRGLASVAGGSLDIAPERLVLLLPAART